MREMEQSLASSRVVVENALFNFLGFGVSALYAFLLIPLVVGYVGVEQFGLWSLVAALTGYIGLADLGLSTSFVKYIAEYATLGKTDEVNKVVHHGFLFYVSVSLLVLMVGYFVFPFLFAVLRISPNHYELAYTIFILSLLGFGAASMITVVASVLSGIQRTDVLNIVMTGMLLAKFIAIWFALHQGFGLVGLTVADFLVMVATIGPLLIVTKKYYSGLSLRFLHYDSAMMGKLLKFGSQLQVSRIAELVQSQFDKLLLTRFIGLSAVSLYDFGSRPLGRLRALPLTAITSLVPAVSALDALENTQRIQSAVLRSTRYMIVLSFPMFAFVLAFSGEILLVWLGNGLAQSTLTMQILSIAYLANVVLGPMALVSQGTGEPQYQMKSTLVQVLLNIVLSTLLVAVVGYYGAVIGTTIAMIAGAVLFLAWYGRRLWSRPLSKFASLAAKPLICVVPSIVGALAAHRLVVEIFSLQSRLGQAMALIIAVAVFLPCYGAMIRWTRTLSEDDRAFVKNALPQRLRQLLRLA
jgi:O-antigen/teichoic acid export membrane protein